MTKGAGMSFYDRLILATERERATLISVPIIQRALRGDVSREQYLAFLGQAYHHVKHTVPLLMACGSRLPDRLASLRSAIVRYVGEENGHDEWILDDIRAAGGNPDEVRAAVPAAATELMVAYAYYTIERIEPVGFFGMVLVLEGTSVALAERAADAIQASLALPRSALRYLYSHGAVDQSHVGFLRGLLDSLDDARDRAAVEHAARRFYGLYADVFRTLPAEAAPARPLAAMGVVR
jgi:pyrroloquinoline quinone (PQQ) biosynthesis protein C